MSRSKLGCQAVRTSPCRIGETYLSLLYWSRILSQDSNLASISLKWYLKQRESAQPSLPQSSSKLTTTLRTNTPLELELNILGFGMIPLLKSWHVDIEMLLGGFDPSLPGTVFSCLHPTIWLLKFHISPLDHCDICVLEPIFASMMFLEHLSYLLNTPNDLMRTPLRGLILHHTISPITR